MKTLLLIFASLIGSFAFAQNPYQPKKETIEAIQKIAFINGNWEGSGWIQMGPERHTFTQKETIATKVNGTVIQIDGLGLDEKDPNITVHQAFAIISYDITKSQYLMKAFRGDGAQIDADFKLLDSQTIEWGFTHPMAGKMRYTITVKNNTWVEVGEMSRDGGKTWTKFFEMTLTKK